MATGPGVNPKTNFSRVNPAALTLVPNQVSDGQVGFDIRTRERWGLKVQNGSNQSCTVRVLGYTHEDVACTKPVVLAGPTAVAAGVNGYFTGLAVAISRIQAEVAPAAASAGTVLAVFGNEKPTA